MAIVEARGLVKRFGEATAVDGVDLNIEAGEVFGLLGPNGAGKTTAISMMCGLLEPTEGDVVVDGHSIRREPTKVKEALGIVPQDIALYPTLTALENLKFWGRMYGLSGGALDERVAEVLAIAGLEDRAKERIETYSGGMKRRINIAAGMLHRPKVLIMDEPTVGIDPQSRNHILETVRQLNESGMTILYTSHYMEEVETLCDRIAIMDGGKVIAQGTKDELRTLVGDEDVITLKVDRADEAACETAAAVGGVERASVVAEGELEVLATDASETLAPVIQALTAAGIHVRSVDVREPNLESVFLHLTGKSLRD